MIERDEAEDLPGKQAGSRHRSTEPEGGAADGGVLLHQSGNDHRQQADLEDRHQPGKEREREDMSSLHGSKLGSIRDQSGLQDDQAQPQDPVVAQIAKIPSCQVQRQAHSALPVPPAIRPRGRALPPDAPLPRPDCFLARGAAGTPGAQGDALQNKVLEADCLGEYTPVGGLDPYQLGSLQPVLR